VKKILLEIAYCLILFSYPVAIAAAVALAVMSLNSFSLYHSVEFLAISGMAAAAAVVIAIIYFFRFFHEPDDGVNAGDGGDYAE
jgi:Cu/Ag efflux pump CusA